MQQITHKQLRELINRVPLDDKCSTGQLKVRCITVDKWNKIYSANYVQECVSSYDKEYVEHCKYLITMDVRVNEAYMKLDKEERLPWAELGDLIGYSIREIVVNDNGTIALVEQAGRGTYGRVIKFETLYEHTVLEWLEQSADLLEGV